MPLQLYRGDRTGPDLESLDRRYDCVEQIGFAKHEKELAQACNAMQRHPMQRIACAATVGRHSFTHGRYCDHSFIRSLEHCRAADRWAEICHSANQSVTVCAAITVRRAGRRSHCSAAHSVTLAVRSATVGYEA